VREYRADGPSGADALTRVRHVAHRPVLEPLAGIPYNDVAPREDHGLATRARAAPRAREVELGQLAGGTGASVDAEYRDTVRTLYELHRRGPPRVHFDGPGNTVARHEVDAVDADQVEILGHRPGQLARRIQEGLV